jgi:hypothetical protein
METREVLLKADKVSVVFERLADGKIRVTTSSWDDAKVILPHCTMSGHGPFFDCLAKLASLPSRQGRYRYRPFVGDLEDHSTVKSSARGGCSVIHSKDCLFRYRGSISSI